jgi:hypothetical protein
VQACAATLENIAAERASAGDNSSNDDADSAGSGGDSGDEDEWESAPRSAKMRAADSSFDAGRAETGKAGEDADERELLDATIKMVRLLANLSIDPVTGTQLGTKAAVLQVRLGPYTSYCCTP